MLRGEVGSRIANRQAWGAGRARGLAGGAVPAAPGNADVVRQDLARELGIAVTLGPKDRRTAQLAASLGTILLDQGRVVEAEPILTQAIAVATAALPPNHPDLAQQLGAMAELRSLQGREGDADQLLRQAVDLRRAVLGPADPATAAVEVALAENALRAGRVAEAEAAYRSALTVQQAALGEQNGMVAATLTQIGDVLLSRGHLAEAEGFHQRAATTVETTLGGNSPALADALDGLARQRGAQNYRGRGWGRGLRPYLDLRARAGDAWWTGQRPCRTTSIGIEPG